MVFFTCNNCGSSLKKNAVEKHPGQCRPFSLSCMDCHKDFYGQDYVAHTRCVTEDEKYSAKGFQSRPPSNKGEVKQQAWVDIVQHVCSTATGLSKDQASLMATLTKHGNVPQKKQKFQNFAMNVWYLAKKNLHVVDSVWELLEAEYKTKKVNETNDTQVEKADIVENNKSVTNGTETKPVEDEVSNEKLSKKERKEKRKRDKYEAELLEVKNEDANLNSCNEDKKTNGTEMEEESGVRPSKKSKKDGRRNDTAQGDSNQQVSEGKREKKKKTKKSSAENEMDTGNVEADVTQEPQGKSKRKKKREDDDSTTCEPAVKKSKTDGSDVINDDTTATPLTSKFNWSDMILQILESAEDKELLVKRLRKKVLSHYQEMAGNGADAADNKTIAKFNKKLAKTPGVVVLKDRAKLKC